MAHVPHVAKDGVKQENKHIEPHPYIFSGWSYITESVDSVCRDGTDVPHVAIQMEAWKTLLKQRL